ncbi:MAG: TonB-dependent receptor [Bacteroidota bacterium]
MKITYQSQLVLIILLLANALLLGQETPIEQSIRGRVFDQSTQQGLEGASIIVQNEATKLGAVSGENGEFVFEAVPVGRYELSVNYIGYAGLTRKGLLLTSGQELVLELGLNEQAITSEEVQIVADQRNVTNEAAVVSAISFSVEELRRIPGGIDDPARMAAKFPGVSPNGSVLTNELNVRGNSSRAVIWRLEGVDIYNPNHFGLLGGSGGSITIFSQQLLANTDFFSGAFPADYGNAIGGVFDARFRNGNTRKREHSLQLGFLGIDASTEGPLSKSGNASYLINYRYSTTGILDGFFELGAIPTFQDVSFKLHFKLPKNATLDVFGLGGLSIIEFAPELDTTIWDRQIGANFGRLNRSLTGTAGLSYFRPLGENTYFKSALIGTGIRSIQLRYYQNRDLVTADTTRRSLDKDFRLSWSSFVNHKFSARHQNRSGLILHGLRSDVFFVQGTEFEPGTGQGTMLTDTLRQGAGQSFLLQAYSRSQFMLSEKWRLNAGVHLMYFPYTGEVSVEPRLGLRWQMLPNQSLSFGYGLHSQMEPFFTYVVGRRNASGSLDLYNADLRFNKAHHLVLGYRWQINEGLRIGLEAYYQSQFNLVVGENLPISRVAALDFIFETFDLDNGGTGRNMGLEFALERSFTDGYYLLANASLFDATFVANDGIERPSQYNAGFVANGVIGKEWQVGRKKGKSNLFNLNLAATYSGNQYFTPIDLPAAIAIGRYVADYANPNSMVQDPLLFLDASLVYQINKANRSSQLSLQIKNLLNQRPLLGEFFDRDRGLVGTQQGTGIFPVLAWKIQF